MTEVSVAQLMGIIGELHVQNALLRVEVEHLKQALIQTTQGGEKRIDGLQVKLADAQCINEEGKVAAEEADR